MTTEIAIAKIKDALENNNMIIENNKLYWKFWKLIDEYER